MDILRKTRPFPQLHNSPIPGHLQTGCHLQLVQTNLVAPRADSPQRTAPPWPTKGPWAAWTGSATLFTPTCCHSPRLALCAVPTQWDRRPLNSLPLCWIPHTRPGRLAKGVSSFGHTGPIQPPTTFVTTYKVPGTVLGEGDCDEEDRSQPSWSLCRVQEVGRGKIVTKTPMNYLPLRMTLRYFQLCKESSGSSSQALAQVWGSLSDSLYLLESSVSDSFFSPTVPAEVCPSEHCSSSDRSGRI